MKFQLILLCVGLQQCSVTFALWDPCTADSLVIIDMGMVVWTRNRTQLTQTDLYTLVYNNVYMPPNPDCDPAPNTLFVLPSLALFPLDIPENGTTQTASTATIMEFLYPTFEVKNPMRPKSWFDRLPSSCDEVFRRQKEPRSGVYALHMHDLGLKPFHTYCREDPDGGGVWTVILRRMSNVLDFQRTFDEYKHGFGAPDENFFLGLERIHTITTAGGPHELWVQMTDSESYDSFAKYDRFAIGGEGNKYSLSVLGTFRGTSGDSLYYHYGQKFSTHDYDYNSCAKTHHGAWWYRQCYRSNLNGMYGQLNQSGVIWRSNRQDEVVLDYVHMAIRPV